MKLEFRFLETGPHLPHARLIDKRVFSAWTRKSLYRKAQKHADRLRHERNLHVIGMVGVDPNKRLKVT